MNTLTDIYDFEKVRMGKKSVLTRIFFDRKKRQTHCFWLSHKQYNNLVDCDRRKMESSVRASIICVFDNDRFIWAGMEYSDYSDREFLIENFNAEWKDSFEIEEKVETHVPEKLEPKNDGPDEDLTRESE